MISPTSIVESSGKISNYAYVEKQELKRFTFFMDHLTLLNI